LRRCFTVRFWNLTAKNPATDPVVLRGEDAIDAVGISQDNHWLVSGSEVKSVRLWDLNAKDPAANPVVLGGHDGQVIAVAISPDNRWLVTGSDDKTARLWLLQVNDLMNLARITGGRNFSADEWRLYFSSEKSARPLTEIQAPKRAQRQKTIEELEVFSCTTADPYHQS
jgi:WD40 repeat protein